MLLLSPPAAVALPRVDESLQLDADEDELLVPMRAPPTTLAITATLGELADVLDGDGSTTRGDSTSTRQRHSLPLNSSLGQALDDFLGEAEVILPPPPLQSNAAAASASI